MSRFFLILCLCSSLIYGQDRKINGEIQRMHPALDELIDTSSKIELLAEGFDWSEGPVWIKDGQYLLFNDIPQNTLFRWDERQGLSIFLRPAGYALGENPPGNELGSNGLYVNPVNGQLVMCDHGNRCIAMLNMGKWNKKVLVDRYDGKRLNSPNDLTISSKGDIYFTDPPYGLRDLDNNPEKELPFNGVFHLTAGGDVFLVTQELPFPNGIGLAPDEKTLYVANSGQEPIWLAFDVDENGMTSNGRTFYDASALRHQGNRGGCDGLAVDHLGNLWATGPGGILVISPQGTLLGIIRIGQATSNCCFGGDNLDELYITADMHLCRIKVKSHGINQ